jgi:hypothetical protein
VTSLKLDVSVGGCAPLHTDVANICWRPATGLDFVAWAVQRVLILMPKLSVQTHSVQHTVMMVSTVDTGGTQCFLLSGVLVFISSVSLGPVQVQVSP